MNSTPAHVIIIGGGYAGTLAAVRLAGRAKDRARVTLLSGDGVLTQRLRLHQVAAGQRVAAPDLDRLTGPRVTVVRGWATELDTARGLVRYAGEQGSGALPYDRVVLATGSTVDTAPVPGAGRYAHTLSGPAAARRLHEAWRDLPSGAVLTVAGAGLTGLEAVTELAGARPGLRVRLLTAGPLAAWLSPAGRAYLTDALRRRGIEVVDGVTVTAAEPDRLLLAGDTAVPSDLAVWCGGFRCPPLAAEAGLATDGRGAVVTDAALRSVTRPEVSAIGDAGAPPLPGGTAFQMTCQAGMPSGAHAADVIDAELRGRTPAPFDFGFIHRPVSLGRGDGLIQFMRRDDTPRGRVLTGRAAAAYKELVSASPVPSIRAERRLPGALRWPGARAAVREAVPA